MTTSMDLIRSCQDSIRQISDKIEGALLYLDAGCLEAFRFIGAFPLLLELGVYAVCSLEDSSPLDITVGWNAHAKDLPRNIVIITSRLLSDAHRYILHCLSTHRTVLDCTIFTSVSEAQEVMEAFTEYGRPDSELILGGTTLLTADDMFELLLGSSSYL